MKTNWYKRKDKTLVLKSGRYKLLEIFKRPGGFYCCFVLDKGRLVHFNGYFTSCLPKRHHAVRYGCKKARELGLLK